MDDHGSSSNDRTIRDRRSMTIRDRPFVHYPPGAHRPILPAEKGRRRLNEARDRGPDLLGRGVDGDLLLDLLARGAVRLRRQRRQGDESLIVRSFDDDP
jgi:hypothetical protein